MEYDLSEKVSDEVEYLFFYTINKINEELNSNGLYNINHVLLSVSSYLSKEDEENAKIISGNLIMDPTNQERFN